MIQRKMGMFRQRLAPRVAILFSVFVLPLLANAKVSASIEGIGTYRLFSHPGGGEAPPTYGFRADELDGIVDSVWTFDFSYPGSAMFMDYDGVSIRIYGVSYGGRDYRPGHDATPGSPYAPGTDGFFAFDFEYDGSHLITTDPMIPTAPSDGDLFDVAGAGFKERGASGTGTIESLGLNGIAGDGDTNELILRSGTTIVGLVDQANGAGDIFHFGLGHRGFAGLSGWGWVSYVDAPHVYATDWLFTAEPVPEPSTWLIFSGLAACFGINAWRKRKRAA